MFYLFLPEGKMKIFSEHFILFGLCFEFVININIYIYIYIKLRTDFFTSDFVNQI
jgi:hypothetical protein